MEERDLARELQGLLGVYIEPTTTFLSVTEGGEPFGRVLFPSGDE